MIQQWSFFTRRKPARLKESVIMGEIVMKDTLIILGKIVGLNIEGEDSIIQTDARLIISKLRKMKPYGRAKNVPNWALFIAGLACVTEENREVFMENLEQVRILSRRYFIQHRNV